MIVSIKFVLCITLHINSNTLGVQLSTFFFLLVYNRIESCTRRNLLWYCCILDGHCAASGTNVAQTAVRIAQTNV